MLNQSVTCAEAVEMHIALLIKSIEPAVKD